MKFIKGWLRFSLGLAIVSIGIVLTIKADLGVAPWDVFHIGLTRYFNISIGQAGQITGIFVVLLSFMLAKVKPTVGTIINIILVGFMIDIMKAVIPDPNTLFIQLSCLGIGVVIWGIGMGIYISAQCGTGPRDSLMMALKNKLSCDISWIKISMELIALSIGYLLGGPVGIGTIVIALGVGPVVSNFFKLINRLSDKNFKSTISKNIYR
ncbi:YczE/YyaS/YitT family protein [Orenia marismortui]|uniref:Membrane protein YczE n=1 Tax=Orenia marismortui TaxID=46469 RepID=A0A4R8GZ90_9FIRM|nr:membrane protein [Orenia marismortui]TDX47991.1 hypothetical protein C7959_1345 [Orenia marismortui]